MHVITRGPFAEQQPVSLASWQWQEFSQSVVLNDLKGKKTNCILFLDVNDRQRVWKFFCLGNKGYWCSVGWVLKYMSSFFQWLSGLTGWKVPIDSMGNVSTGFLSISTWPCTHHLPTSTRLYQDKFWLRRPHSCSPFPWLSFTPQPTSVWLLCSCQVTNGLLIAKSSKLVELSVTSIAFKRLLTWFLVWRTGPSKKELSYHKIKVNFRLVQD